MSNNSGKLFIKEIIFQLISHKFGGLSNKSCCRKWKRKWIETNRKWERKKKLAKVKNHISLRLHEQSMGCYHACSWWISVWSKASFLYFPDYTHILNGTHKISPGRRTIQKFGQILLSPCGIRSKLKMVAVVKFYWPLDKNRVNRRVEEEKGRAWDLQLGHAILTATRQQQQAKRGRYRGRWPSLMHLAEESSTCQILILEWRHYGPTKHRACLSVWWVTWTPHPTGSRICVPNGDRTGCFYPAVIPLSIGCEPI